MSKVAYIAHAYAKAAFSFAEDVNKLDKWFVYLRDAKTVVENEQFKEYIHNPKFNFKQLVDLVVACLGKTEVDIEFQNFLLLLASNHRLQYLAVVDELFNKLYFAKKNILNIIIQVAFTIDNEQQNNIESILAKQTGKAIVAEVEVCPELIGGIKIKVGDMLIDASISGRLAKLAATIM